MIDTHCHLTDARLHSQLDKVLSRAAEAGVTRCITIGTDLHDSAEAQRLSRVHDLVYFAAGIHPTFTRPYSPGDVRFLRDLLADPRCVALGEIGLDAYWKDVPMEHQRVMFHAQLELAAELKVPVILHTRDAVDAALAVLERFPTVHGVFHCFGGSVEQANEVVRRGFYIGVDGPLTYRNASRTRAVVEAVPTDRVLIETDAPYLIPEPGRSRGVKVNEPAFVRSVLDALAGLWKVGRDDADRITTASARQLFGQHL